MDCGWQSLIENLFIELLTSLKKLSCYEVLRIEFTMFIRITKISSKKMIKVLIKLHIVKKSYRTNNINDAYYCLHNLGNQVLSLWHNVAHQTALNFYLSDLQR